MSEQTRRNFLMTTGAGLIAAAATRAGAQATQLAPPDKQPPNLKVPTTDGKKLGWAIVGLGNLALNQIMPGFKEGNPPKPGALVSGHPDKAQKVAGAYGIDRKSIYNYDNYDLMNANPDIDVVYVVLPNSMHAEYTIRAAKAGKHVLCEKPMANSVADCQAMIDACKAANRKLAIGYRMQHEPMTQKARELARAAGTIKPITG